MTEEERRIQELEDRIRDLEANQSQKIEMNYAEDSIPGKLNTLVNKAQEKIEEMTPEQEKKTTEELISIVLWILLTPVVLTLGLLLIGFIKSLF